MPKNTRIISVHTALPGHPAIKCKINEAGKISFNVADIQFLTGVLLPSEMFGSGFISLKKLGKLNVELDLPVPDTFMDTLQRIVVKLTANLDVLTEGSVWLEVQQGIVACDTKSPVGLVASYYLSTFEPLMELLGLVPQDMVHSLYRGLHGEARFAALAEKFPLGNPVLDGIPPTNPSFIADLRLAGLAAVAAHLQAYSSTLEEEARKEAYVVATNYGILLARAVDRDIPSPMVSDVPEVL